MKATTVERWIAGIGIVAIAGAAFWLGSLEARVSRLEKAAEQTSIGPRGQNCEQIVGKLVDHPLDKALRQLADEWGCRSFATASAPVRDVEPRNAAAH